MFVISIPAHNTEQLEQLEEAREHMQDYIPLTRDTDKKQCWDRIKGTMLDQPLSSWFSLYIHVFFNDVFCCPKPLLPDNVILPRNTGHQLYAANSNSSGV